MPFPPNREARPFSHYQVALVLLAMLPLIGGFALLAWWQNERLRDSIVHGLARTADVLSLAVDREIGTVRADLEALGESEVLAQLDWAAFYREAARVAQKRPGSWITLADRTGQQLVDAHSAVRLARLVRPDVALLDLGLPDIDGFEVAQARRSEPGMSGTRLIALTGYGRPEDREKALQIGFNLFCIKPIDRDLLKQILA